jgi:hypothetical protein
VLGQLHPRGQDESPLRPMKRGFGHHGASFFRTRAGACRTRLAEMRLTFGAPSICASVTASSDTPASWRPAAHRRPQRRPGLCLPASMRGIFSARPSPSPDKTQTMLASARRAHAAGCGPKSVADRFASTTRRR